MEGQKGLYDKLVGNKLYTKSFDEFNAQYGSPEGQKELFSKLSGAGYYSKSEGDFVNQYFSAPIQKKKSTPSSTESVLPTKKQPTQLVSPPKPEQIGFWENIKNSFVGAGEKAVASLLSIPEAAQRFAEDIVLTASGKDDEFNALPSSVKKEIRTFVKQAPSKTPFQAATKVSSQAADYLENKSKKTLERTIQDEGDVFSDISTLTTNPSSENAMRLVNRLAGSVAKSAPYMAMGAMPGGLGVIGVATAAEKRKEDVAETGDVGLGNAFTAAVHGGAEAFFEKYTQGILGKAGGILKGTGEAAKKYAEGLVMSILKDFGIEGASEGATTLIQEVADKINKGEEINYGKLFRQVANDAVIGGATGSSITGGAVGIKGIANKSVAAKKYIQSKLLPADKQKKIEDIVAAQTTLKMDQGPDVNPQVNSMIQDKIDQLTAEHNAIIAESAQAYERLTDDEIGSILEVEFRMEDNYSKAQDLINDTAMDDATKQLLLSDLLKKQNELKQKRDAIQKQATSEIPVQPEAAVSGEVAQGEPQAEPQVTTEKSQKEVAPEAGGMVQMAEIPKQLEEKFGLNENQAQAASVVIDKITDTIAERTNQPKEKVVESISFEKQEPIKTEEQFDVAIEKQPINWEQFPTQAKGKEIASRNKVLTQAANDLLNGKITNEEYKTIVNQESPIRPIETFFNPSTDQEVKSSLEPAKVPLVNSTTAKGDVFVDPKDNTEYEIVSDKVGLRLDLPAYLNKNKWVVTVHADAKNNKTGKVSKDKAVSYSGVAKIKDVTFDYNPNLAAKIAKGESSRETKFKMRGTWVPVEGANIDEQNANAKKEAEAIMNDPSWVQIGANPFRHSYFYSRSTGKPIVSADEVLQIGGLVFAKNPEEVEWNDARFGVTKQGKPVLDKEGRPVLFQDDKASVSVAEDGKFIITALTNPDISSPLHEIAHVFEHYLTDQEKSTVLDWSKDEEWTRDTSEKFARGFEKYLADGVAPTAELGKIFEAFKEWLLNIYNGIVDSKIDIELNDAMKDIYSKMLAGKKQATVEEEVKTPFQQVERGAQAKQKTIDQIEKAKRRGRPLQEAVKRGIYALRKTIAYEQANDVVRESMEREVRKEYGIKERKAPTVKKILGEKKPEKILVDEMKALVSQLKLEGKAAKEGADAVREASKSLIAKITSFGKTGKLTPFQTSRLIKLFGRNLLNAKQFESAVNNAQKIVENSQYAKRLDDAYKLRKKLKSFAKQDKKFQADVIETLNKFLKIDPNQVASLDLYESVAMELLRATKPITVSKYGVSGREAARLADINKFSDKEIAKQEERLKESLLDQYKYLVDAGLISSDMSYKDILDYIKSVEENEENEDSTKSEAVSEYVKQAFDDVVYFIKENEMLEDLDIADAKLVGDFIEMDMDELSLSNKVKALDAVQNFVVNGITTNMGAILNDYVGVQNAKADVKAGLKAQPIKVGLVGRLGRPGQLYSNIWGEFISKTDSLLANAFRSTDKAIKFLKDSGFSGIVKGFVDATKNVNNFADVYSKEFKDTKPNGKEFDSAYNTYERGIFAAFYRTILNGTDAEIKSEFDRQMAHLSQTISALRETGKKELVRKADLYDEVYQKIKDAESIDDLKKIIDPINQKAVQKFVDFWAKFYPQFRNTAAQVYNVLLDADVNYTPEMYEKLALDVQEDLLSKGSFKIGFDLVNTQKSGNLLRNNKIKPLPKRNGEVSRVRNYDFDFGNIEAMKRTMVDLYTTPSVQQYLGYTNSKAFKEIFPDKEQRDLIKQRLNFNVDALRGRQNTSAPAAIKSFGNLVGSLSKYGTRIGLGSVSSWAKQSVPMAANTVINLGTNTTAFSDAFKDVFDTNAVDLINKSGYGISLRGAEAQTSIDYAENLLEKSDLKSYEKVAKALAKVGDFYIEQFLKKPDVAIANISWIAYYRKKLKDMGMSTDIDWSNHKLVPEAADYAEFMVQDQQNMNIAELGGKLLASKNPAVKIARQLLFPFASYQFNLKDKNNRAVTILTSKNSSKQEKIEASKSLASGMVESIVFDLISAGVSTGLMALAYASIGDEDEKQKKLQELNEALNFEFLKKLSATKLLTEFGMPLPPQLDIVTIGAANALLDKIYGEEEKGTTKGKKGINKEIADKENKLNQPFKFYSKDSDFIDIIGGVPAIGAESIADLMSDIKTAQTGEYTNKYGKTIKYTDEERKLIAFSVIPKMLAASNLLPREALTYGKDLRKIIDQKAKLEPQNKKKKKGKKIIL